MTARTDRQTVELHVLDDGAGFPPEFLPHAWERFARADVGRTLEALGADWSARDDLGKVSVVGAGMKSHPGVAAKTFATLHAHGVEPAVVTTSPIKIACHIPTDDVEKAVSALHEAFDLG